MDIMIHFGYFLEIKEEKGDGNCEFEILVWI